MKIQIVAKLLVIIAEKLNTASSTTHQQCDQNSVNILKETDDCRIIQECES